MAPYSYETLDLAHHYKADELVMILWKLIFTKTDLNNLIFVPEGLSMFQQPGGL